LRESASRQGSRSIEGAKDLTERTVSARMHGHLRVFNSTKGTLLASQVEIADSFPRRVVGLLGRRALHPGGGLWLFPSNAIHTIGMRFAIDVVMLSRNATVVKVCERVRPFSIVWPNLRAQSVLELPAHTIAKSCTAAGDLLQIEIAER
jgi:uncharacterized membrane protein (UPF0127 family)